MYIMCQFPEITDSIFAHFIAFAELFSSLFTSSLIPIITRINMSELGLSEP